MRRAISGLAVAVALAAIPGTVLAQGFQVNEHGTCVMGRAGTGVAAPCDDASTIFYNPAGLAGMQGFTISAGVTAIYAIGNFVDDLNQGEAKLQNGVIPVPHLYAAYGKDKWAAGVGVFVPYGLGTIWPDTFEGRFNGYDNDLRSIYIQPTASYQVLDWLMVGAGLDIVIGSLKLTQRLDLSAQELPLPGLPAGTTVGQLGIPFHTEFAEGLLEGHGAMGIGGNFGVRIKPVESVDIGVRYITRVKLDYDGTATFAQVPSGLILPPNNGIAPALGLDPAQPLPVDSLVAGLGLFADGATLSDQTVTTSITMPDQFSVGVAIQAFDDLKVLGEWQWVHWSLFETLEADFQYAPNLTLHENYRNTNGFRFGLEWATTENVDLRGGYLYHEAAAPDQTVTPLLPEGARNEFTLGGGFRMGSRFAFDVAYQFIRQDKRRGRVRDAEPGQTPTADLNSGVYTFNAHLFAATFVVHF
ncbi:MAG: outer membrane protein transport protein [Gemmatimonadota bacterium]|nr:MAG: outer membrane protein transport protein [Gemmatimonadota bacterium]